MAEAKKRGRAGKSNGGTGPQTGAAGGAAGGAGAKPGKASASAQGAASLLGRADQLGAILSKGLDLAEAGLSLGLTVLNRVGGIAQQRILDGLSVDGGAPRGAPGAPPPGSPQAGVTEEPAYDLRAEAAPPVEEPQYYITNPLPLAPGAPVRISFSLNNDSTTAPKRVSLRVEGFTGGVSGARVDEGGFAVKPAKKTIAPMDFEKFVLQGALPPEAPADVYHGWVVVCEKDEFRIPVRLIAGG